MIHDGFEPKSQPTTEPRITREGQMTASGLGGEKLAYQRLLFNLCKSGCTIPKIQVLPGLLTAVILYTVEGTRDEIEIFEKQVNG